MANAKAVTAGDLLYARLPAFHRQVDTARRVLAHGLERAGGPVGCSFSGGKDSTVALHLLLQARPDAPAIFADSGAEYPETLAFIGQVEREWRVDLVLVPPARTILELHEATGWWDWSGRDLAGDTGAFKRVLIQEPMERARTALGLRGQVIGLRSQESPGRDMLFRTRGSVHGVQHGELVHIHPLASWSVQDVWAYIALHDLPYNPVYDTLTRLGVSREQQRVSSWAGTTGSGYGRFAVLKAGWPDLYQRFADAFPRIKEAT